MPSFEFFEEEGFEEQTKHTSKKKSTKLFWKKHRHTIIKIAAVVSILCLLFVAVVASLSATFAIRSNHYNPSPPDYFNQWDVLESVEYQIALNPKENWTRRSEMIDLWISTINYNSELLHLNKKSAEEEVFVQYHLVTKGEEHCNTPSNLQTRIRHNVFGTQTVLDVKGDEGTKEKSCSDPFWPSKPYYNDSRQKCEEDVHPCFHKFTRGTAVSFEKRMLPTKCEELKEIFPDAFYTVTKENKQNPVKSKAGIFMWRLQWKGVVGNQMNYEVTFDVRYSGTKVNITSVQRGGSEIIEGEWSLRFFTEGQQEWDLEVVNDFQTLFFNLVMEFDIYEEHKECAKKFFAGESLDHMGVRLAQHPDRVSGYEFEDYSSQSSIIRD